MYNGLITCCDVCGEVVEGKKGTANITKTYITIKGNILYCVAKDGEYRQYWAKRRDDTNDLHFCDEKCLMGYLQGKKLLVDQIKKDKQEYDNEFAKF